MSGKNVHITETAAQIVADSRLLPLAAAGLICFTIAVLLGTGSWYLFGSHTRQKNAAAPEANIAELMPATELPKTAENAVAGGISDEKTPGTETKPIEPAARKLPENVVAVGGGEVVTGGGDTRQPLERAIIKDFAIGETEVTNAQYAQFVTETNHQPPVGWNKSGYPAGEENFPVTGVSWLDATDFCRWMQKKVGLPVRLPTEAEWEYAAHGRETVKYPWGDKWNADAVVSKESGGKISAVKSFSLNRSPFGAFDMAGNVWEWTQDKVGKREDVTDEKVKKALETGQVLRIVKGGSAQEKASQISAQARYEIPESARVATVGFRYVVITQ